MNSLTKKYVYVHHCSLAQFTHDNFRKVLGRAWVPSDNLGLRYGYEVEPPVMKMRFGPVTKWEHDYFPANVMPATTQIVSIRPNPYYFPPSETDIDLPEFEGAGPENPGYDGPSKIEDPCCGWYAYLGRFFADHFSSGQPIEILRTVLEHRVLAYTKEVALINGSAGGSDLDEFKEQIDKRHYPNDKCSNTIRFTSDTPDNPQQDPPTADTPPGARVSLAMERTSTSTNSTTGNEITGLTAQASTMRSQRQQQIDQATGRVNKPSQDLTTDDIQRFGGSIVVDTPDDDTGQDNTPKDPDRENFRKSTYRLFRDIWFQTFTPFSEVESQVFEGKEKALASDLRMNYNFFLAAYERELQGDSLSEIVIPNIYLSVYRDGSVPYVLYLSENVNCRYKEFAKLILQKGYKEYLLPVKQQPFIQDKNIYSKSFPMDATISFGTDRSTFVADALEDSKMEVNMLRRASEGSIHSSVGGVIDASAAPSGPPAVTALLPGLVDIVPVPEQEMNFVYAKRYYETLDNPYTPRADIGSRIKPYKAAIAARRPLRTFDFYQWMMSLPDFPASSVQFPPSHVFLGRPNDSTDMALRSGLYQPQLSYLANYFILSGKINEISRTHLRTYQQMMRGDTPHSETILYKVSKYATSDLRSALGDELVDLLPTKTQAADAFPQLEATFDAINSVSTGLESVKPIQNFWIPNSNSLDVIEYVDTQIKYNKDYTYTVTAYELSVGTEYFYSQYFGKNAKDPQPQPCENAKPGIQTMAGPFQILQNPETGRIDEAGSDPTGLRILRAAQLISTGAALEGEVYSQVNRLLSDSGLWLGDADTCEGTGMAFLSSKPYFVPGTNNTALDIAVLCYCFDYSYDKDNYVLLADVKRKEYDDTGKPSGGTGKDEPACTILAQMKATLTAELNIADPSDALLAALEEYGITDLSKEYEYTNRARYRVDECPDGWKEGEIQEYSVEREETLGKGNLEVVFTGRADFEAVCFCPPPEECQETFLVTTFPCLKVHEIPYMLWTGEVMDSFPVGPDIEIDPYRAVNNEMLFKIGAGLGDYYDYPVPITERDRKMFRALQKSQRLKDGTVLFKSDDPVRRFEMFMTTEKPRRYTDFANAQKTTFSTAVKAKPGQFADAVSTIENLIPNKKYYYIFRSVDIHGHVSNPTPIYEVELVDTDGAIYPLINIYEPDPSLPVDLSKQGQRLLQIRPEYLQSIVDLERSALTDSESAGTPGGASIRPLKLGIRDERIWDKKFKLRLTSCETRRMLDINLKFNIDHQILDVCPPENESKTSSGNKGITLPPDILSLIPGSSSKTEDDAKPPTTSGTDSVLDLLSGETSTRPASSGGSARTRTRATTGGMSRVTGANISGGSSSGGGSTGGGSGGGGGGSSY